MSTFYDVVRHLVEHGPWATDTDRETAFQAVNVHEQLQMLQASIAHDHIDPPAVDQAPVEQPAGDVAAAVAVPASPEVAPDPVTVQPDWQ